MVEIGVDKNSTIMFPAPLMSTISELDAFLNREVEAACSGLAPSQPGATEATAEAGEPAATPPTNGKLVPGRTE
jgi:hypothetical protein